MLLLLPVVLSAEEEEAASDGLDITNSNAGPPPPTNYLICDRTGFRVTVKEGLKQEWNGAMVRKESWERRHPQELMRTRAERANGSPRPEQQDRFISDTYGSAGVTVEDLTP